MFQEWSKHDQTLPPDVSSDPNNTVKEGTSQLPILLVIQESDHMRQKNIIGLLPTKEDTQLRDAIFKQRLLNDVLGITEQSHDFSLDEFMKGLQFSVITSLKETQLLTEDSGNILEYLNPKFNSTQRLFYTGQAKSVYGPTGPSGLVLMR